MMTFQKTVLFFLILLLQNLMFSSQPTPSAGSVAPPSSASSSILMSLQVSPTDVSKFKNLNDTVVPYPIRGVLLDGTIQQGILNRTIKAMPPAKTWPILAKGGFSVLRAKSGDFASYPGGSAIFPGYSDLSAKFDAMIAVFQKNPEFIPFFRKVHINVLNQLYQYLMSIYINFNLQHTGIVQNSDGSLQVNIPAFMKEEKDYAANKKTLIINHLMNVIESQFNSAIRSYVPKLPQIYASYVGKTLVQNDYSVDLTHFLDQQVQSVLSANKKVYLQGLATYLAFFQAYTAYLDQPYPNKSAASSASAKTSTPAPKTSLSSLTAFVDVANQISQFLYGAATQATDKNTAAFAKMNPPLFAFNYDDMRALKIIPYLAKSLPQTTKNILWPEHIVQAANEGIVINTSQGSSPIAYFRTPLGTAVKNTTNDPTIPLFICMRNGQNLFEEELIAQPDWLNSWAGVSNILKACFGDFSALLGLQILDPCMETLINMVIATQQGQDISTMQTSSDACTSLIATWKQSQVAISSGAVASGASGALGQATVPGANLPGANLSGTQLPNLPSLPNNPAVQLPVVGG